jgi:asparagine synthetase B (glutamine-hydrolysing)
VCDRELLRAQTDELLYESDWLGSRPYFFNMRTGRASHNINHVIDLTNLEFDPEGFNDYLDFGYSVFERTPLRDVRMLRYSSRLFSGPDGLRVEYLEDPAWEWLERQSTVEEVLELASAKINEAAAGVDSDIVVPTSGGYDSRLINVLVTDRKRIRAFSYGTSDDPARSVEVVKAAELARRLGIRWELVPLGAFHRYFDDWDALFGVSTHAHGMYQIEFYRRILERVPAGSTMLSGACGERFAGDDQDVSGVEELSAPAAVYELFRSPSMNANSRFSYLRSENLGALQLLETTPRIRTEILPRVFTMQRIRIGLLSYLLSVPASLGFLAKGPYLDIDLAMRMLTLPAEQRLDRRWQREFFARQGVDLEARALSFDGRNTLNFQGMRKVPLRPLNVDLLREVVRPDYLRWINRNVGTFGLYSEAMWRLALVRGFRRGVHALERRTGVRQRRLLAYNAYLTLKPIESLLLRRDRARRGEELS